MTNKGKIVAVGAKYRPATAALSTVGPHRKAAAVEKRMSGSKEAMERAIRHEPARDEISPRPARDQRSF